VTAEATPAPEELPTAAPHLPWSLLLGIPAATVIVSGLAVQAGIGVLFGKPWGLAEALDSLARATLYVAVMWSGMVQVFRWTVGHWPLRSAADVARHVGVVVAASVVLFTVASGLHRIAFGDVMPWTVFALIAAVSALSTAVLATILYGLLAVRRLRAAEAAALRAELRALRAQVNPHFLFNALNTIAALARTRPADAERVTEHLADLFRYSLAASERPTVTLAEEVRSAELYLAIETTRFGDALRTEFDVPPDVARLPLPSLVLQPLVENAVKHGLRHAGGDGTVTVRARRADGRLTVEVLDTGRGFGTDRIADVLGRGTGLTNVHERLRAALGPAAGLHLVPGGIALTVPADA
jgi:hypothetical protein